MCCRPTRECSRYVWLSAHQNSSRHCPMLSHNSAAALQNILMQHVAFWQCLPVFLGCWCAVHFLECLCSFGLVFYKSFVWWQLDVERPAMDVIHKHFSATEESKCMIDKTVEGRIQMDLCACMWQVQFCPFAHLTFVFTTVFFVHCCEEKRIGWWKTLSPPLKLIYVLLV